MGTFSSPGGRQPDSPCPAENSPKEGRTPCTKLPPETPLASPSLCSVRTRMAAEGLKLGGSSLFWLPTYAWHSGQ